MLFTCLANTKRIVIEHCWKYMYCPNHGTFNSDYDGASDINDFVESLLHVKLTHF